MITVALEPPGSVGKALINAYKIAAETIFSWSKKVWSRDYTENGNILHNS